MDGILRPYMEVVCTLTIMLCQCIKLYIIDVPGVLHKLFVFCSVFQKADCHHIL